MIAFPAQMARTWLAGVGLAAATLMSFPAHAEYPERQVRVLLVDLIRRPPVGDLVQHDLNDLGVRPFDPGAAPLVQSDVCGRRCGRHDAI